MRRNIGLGLALITILLIQLSNGASLKRRPTSKETLEYVPVQVVYSDILDEQLLEGRGRNLPPTEASGEGPPVPPQNDEEDDEEEDDEDDDEEDDDEEDDDDNENGNEDDDDKDDDKDDGKESVNSKNKNKQPPKKGTGPPPKRPSGAPTKQRRPDAANDEANEGYPLPLGLEDSDVSPGDISEARLLFSGNHWNGYGSRQGYGGFGQGQGLLGNYFGGNHGYSHGYHGHPGQQTYHNGFYTTIE